MFAVISSGGKQYIVEPGKKVKIEKIANAEGEQVEFDKVLLVFDGESVKLGRPYVDKASVTGIIVKQGRAKKIKILRYHSKTRMRRAKGHRQHFTEVEVKKISPPVF